MKAERVRRAGRTWCAAALLLACPAVPATAALCGDASGDGFLTATDALATLRLAVAGGYDRRGDVIPRRGGAAGQAGDDKLAAGDALEVLKASVESRVPPCRGFTASRVVVTTAPYDFYSSAGFAVVDLATHEVRFRGGSLAGDAVVRTPLGSPVVVNRHNFNSLQVLDIDDANLPTVKDCSVSDGFNSNPQDVLLVSPDKGYATPYAGPNLFVLSPPVLFEPGLDPSCKTFLTGRIDLSGFDDDGIPQMDQMAVVGGDLFVALQLLDDDVGGLPPKGNGRIAVIDTATDAVKGSIELSFANPFAETKGLPWDEFQQLLFAGGPGDVRVLDDGGIEAVDPATLSSAGLLITGADIQANIFDYVIVGRRRAFAIVADKQSNSVVELLIGPAPEDRAIRRVLLSSTALITDIEMSEGGELWVAYRGETFPDPPGLRVFDVTTGSEVTPEPIPLGQAPFTLAFVD